jgi:hypothetical protein
MSAKKKKGLSIKYIHRQKKCTECFFSYEITNKAINGTVFMYLIYRAFLAGYK